jgi:outer membrane receptor for monomeric catechols
MQVHSPSFSASQNLEKAFEGQSPEQQVNFMSNYQLTQNLSFNLVARYVDKLSTSKVSSHLDMDIGLRWQLAKNINLALFGKNLLHNTRLEYQQTVFAPESTKTEREGYLTLELKF